MKPGLGQVSLRSREVVMVQSLQDKHIIVGVTGGIAAYKAIEVVSRLRKKGAQVKVVMTEHATHIATPMTFGEISGHPVAIDMWEEIMIGMWST